MDKDIRRRKILDILQSGKGVISATKLAEEFGVTRPVIVGDIALLRAEGYDIVSTARGYTLQSDEREFSYIGVVYCNHSVEDMRKELITIVELGGTVIDVSVYHHLYGEISTTLNISTVDEVDEFIKKISVESHKPLGSLTDGLHIHAIGCASERIFNIIKSELSKESILIEDI